MEGIILEWNPWWKKEYKFDYVERDKLKEIIPWIRRKEIVSILGVRRSGKTTLLFQIIQHLLKKNIPKKNIIFIKADDDRVNTKNLIDRVLSEYYKLVNPEGKMFLFIDEIQDIENWQKTLKRIYDLQSNLKIFISGSNASILKGDLSSSLAGRFSCFELFPFTFKEFLKAKGLELKNKLDLVKEKNKIRHLLVEYINFGSFPEVVLEEEKSMKKELAKFYFDSIFYRDIIRRKNIRNPLKMEKLVKYYLQNIANLANFTKIGKLLELTTDSVGEYTKALEDAYVIFPINLFEYSYKKQIINPKKIYCVDTGIRNIVGFKFSEDRGRFYENIVFVSLKRTKKEIYYWKSKNECDFIVKEGKKIEAIQVSYDSEKEREVKGLLDALEHFKLKSGLIITEDKEGEEKLGERTIRYIPLWKWLLTYK